jgi:hypothetical protein
MKIEPHYIEGKLIRDRLGWMEFAKLDGKRVKDWIWNRLEQLPENAIVRITCEVVDNGAPSDSA